jgi:hypothetical protein
MSPSAKAGPSSAAECFSCGLADLLPGYNVYNPRALAFNASQVQQLVFGMHQGDHRLAKLLWDLTAAATAEAGFDECTGIASMRWNQLGWLVGKAGNQSNPRAPLILGFRGLCAGGLETPPYCAATVPSSERSRGW